MGTEDEMFMIGHQAGWIMLVENYAGEDMHCSGENVLISVSAQEKCHLHTFLQLFFKRMSDFGTS